MPITTLNPLTSPRWCMPQLLGIDYVASPTLRWGEHSRTEAWELSNGEVIVIVSNPSPTSMIDGVCGVADAIAVRWARPGAKFTIIEDRGTNLPFTSNRRFVIAVGDGTVLPINEFEWGRKGLVLPR